jgi:hypothetical protein
MRYGRAMARTGILNPIRFARFGILAISFTSLLAACSASAGPSTGVVTLASAAPDGSAAPSASAATDPRTAMLDYAQCMRDRGIDMPDPVFVENGAGGTTSGGTFKSEAGSGPGTNPKSNAAFKAADTACQHFLANIKNGIDAKPMSAAEQKAFLDFSACMRDHGIDMADPTFEGGGVSVQIGGPGGGGNGPKIDPQSPAFQAAQAACQHIFTDAGVKGIGGGSGPSTNATGPNATTGPSAETPAP